MIYIFFEIRLYRKTVFPNLIISPRTSFRLGYKITNLLSQVTRGYNGERPENLYLLFIFEHKLEVNI